MIVAKYDKEMPKTCEECPLYNDHDYFCHGLVVEQYEWRSRRSDCPLEEQKSGKWIHRRVITENKSVDLCVCPICNEEFSHDAETGITIDNYKYCPNCGSRMSGC